MIADVTELDLDCWTAACYAVAILAPQYGVSAAQVQALCDTAPALIRAHPELDALHVEVLLMRRMTSSLVAAMVGRGAATDRLVSAARDAFSARYQLAGPVTPSDLFEDLYD
jgi:hypothetical protein